MAVERVRVAINGYGVIGKRVADVVALMDDMTVAGVADVGWCGLALDASLNESAVGREMEIGAATSRPVSPGHDRDDGVVGSTNHA